MKMTHETLWIRVKFFFHNFVVSHGHLFSSVYYCLAIHYFTMILDQRSTHEWFSSLLLFGCDLKTHKLLNLACPKSYYRNLFFTLQQVQTKNPSVSIIHFKHIISAATLNMFKTLSYRKTQHCRPELNKKIKLLSIFG